MPNTELLPCPFCMCADINIERIEEYYDHFAGVCSRCGARSAWDDNEELATKHWNTRGTQMHYEYRLVCTSDGCPEQYDVYLHDEEVGYLRLRHGHFRAEVNDNIVYEAFPKGDGSFESDEREQYITNALIAIDNYRKAHCDV